MTPRTLTPVAVLAILVGFAATLYPSAELKASRTVFSSSAKQVVDGSPVTLKASVAAMVPSDGIPSGSVEFADGATILGTVDLAAAEGMSEASLTVNLPLGPHPISVRYAGDSAFGGSFSVPEFVLVVGQ